MSKREKKLVIIGIIILSISLAIKYFFVPWIDNYNEIVREANEISMELEKGHLQLTGLQKNKARFKELYIECKSLERLFFIGTPADLRLEIINYLDEEIIRSGLEIVAKEFIIERINQDNIPIKFSYKIQLNGGYCSLLTFMESLEKQDKYFCISQLELKSSIDESKLDIFLLINSYCLEGGKDES